MELSDETIDEFASVLVARGLGIYGRQKMAEICEKSGVALMDDDTIDWLASDKLAAIKQLIINYSKFNLPAKMTAIVLAKRYNIPIPEEELGRKKRRVSRFRRLFKRS